MDLTEILSQNKPENIIDKVYEGNFIPRTHLGLSQCGNECDRFLWFKHRGYMEPAPEGRTLRLFELGNKVEDIVVADLKQAGYTVTDDQKAVVFDWGDTKLTGHIDGKITGLEESGKIHLLEIKSACLKQFNILKKKGYCNWHRTYRFQIMAYMLGLELDRCLVVVYCKDNSELYTERIKLDKQWITKKLEHVFEIITQEHCPQGICHNATFWKSRFCGFRDICFK